MNRTISNTFVVNTIEDGENTSALDIDNEYDGVNTDSTQKILFAKTVSTIVRLYDGGTEVDIKNMGVNTASGISVTNMPLPSIATFSSSAESGGHGKVLSWAFIAGQTMSESYNVTISLTYNNVPYTATFTIKASKGQAVFNLKPSYSALPCKKVNGTITIPSLSMNVEVTDSNTPILLTSFDSDGAVTYNTAKYYVVYSFTSMPASKTPSGTSIIKWPSGNSVTIPTTDTPTNVYIAIFNSSNVLLDRETVPIVEDGEDGASPYMADLDNEMDAIACNNVGTPLIQQQVTTTVSMWYGTQSRSMTIRVYDNNDSNPTNEYTNGTAKSTGITVSWANDTGVITVTFATQYNNVNVTLPEKKIFCIKIVSPNIENTGNIIRYLYFTVNCMRGAAVYQVVPSTNTITKHSDGSYTPVGTGNIECVVTKTIGGTTSVAPPSEYTLKMAVDGGNEMAYAAKRIDTITSKIEYILYVPSGGSYVIDRETVPVITDGESGHDVNPNILIDTLNYKNDNNQWYALNSSLQSDLYNGQKIRYSNYNNRDSGKNYARTAEQEVYSESITRLSPNTWYTLSVYCKGSYGKLRLSLLQAGYNITNTIKADGVNIEYEPSTDITDAGAEFGLTDTWTRHSLSFKTNSSISNTYPKYVSIRLTKRDTDNSLSSSAELYISMPKLEAGEYATAYMANEDDLKGADGQDGQNGQNGADGKDAATVVATPSQVLFNAKNNGNASGTQYFTLNYGLYVNNVACSVASAAKVTLTLPTNVNLNGNKGTSSSQIYITDDTAVSTGAIIQISIEGTLSGKTYNASTSIPVAGVRAGANGAAGKVGRAYYYGGEWDATNNTKTFLVSDAQVPYFHTSSGYYIFNYFPSTSSASYTMYQMWNTYTTGTPKSFNNDPWVAMTSDFEYLITKAIFGDYANFGGAIINQDWLTSVHGDVNVAWRRNTKITSSTPIEVGSTKNINNPTWIGQFHAKTTGTHNFYINYECNGSPFTIILWDRNENVNDDIFSQYIGSDGGAVNISAGLISGHQYLLCAYKSNASNPNPTVTNVTMDAPAESGSSYPNGNYLYLDPMTGGAETILSDNEITVSTSPSTSLQTIVAYDMPLASLSSYYFYFEFKCGSSGNRTVHFYFDRKENGSWVNKSGFGLNYDTTVSGTEWKEYMFNRGFGSGYGGQYRIRIYATDSVIMRKVSIAAGASFAPQFGVDLYRGTVSMNNVHVRGMVDAIDGEFHGTVYAKDGEFSGKVSAGKYLDIGTYGTGNCLRLNPSTPSITGFNNTNKTLEVKSYTSHMADGKTKYGGSVDMGQTFYSSGMWQVNDGTYSVTCVPAGGLIQIADASGSVSIRKSGNVFHIKGVNALLPLLSQAEIGELYRDTDGFVHIRVS